MPYCGACTLIVYTCLCWVVLIHHSQQARATIQEPSRPVTPASLDARVDHIPESDSYFHSAPKSNTSSFLYANILSSSSHEPSRSSNTSKPILTHSSSGTDISLLLLDISDNLTLIETCLHSVTVDASYLSTALHNMTQSVDKFAKYMKSVSFSDNTGEYYFNYLYFWFCTNVSFIYCSAL